MNMFPLQVFIPQAGLSAETLTCPAPSGKFILSGLRRMRQALETLVERTDGQGFYEITGSVIAWLKRHEFTTGVLTIFCRRTSASLAITENASPAVRADALRFLARLAPEDGRYEHDEEGPDDMPAHLRALVTQPSLSVPLQGGRLLLGTWQGIFLVEHRTRPHHREIVLHGIGT